jgi:hypothetical protein
VNFSKTTFWEYDVNKLDADKDSTTIIPRIAMRGSIEEIREMRSYYGDEKNQEVLTTVRYLDKYTLSLFSNIYNIPNEEFRCYVLKQLNPTSWDY